MHDHEVSLSHHRSWFVLQCWWEALDEIEQTFTAGTNMRAVLSVARRPKLLSRAIISSVEQGVERLQHRGFVLLLHRLLHGVSSPSLGPYGQKTHAASRT